MRYLLASTARALSLALAGETRSATVEAEFGDDVVEGALATLAHHGPRKANPVPCSRENGDVGADVIGLSHVDLDALGGVLALQGRKPEGAAFWALAAFVDVNGVHKLALSGASEATQRQLAAWASWNEANRLYAPRSPMSEGKPVPATAETVGAYLAPEAKVTGWIDAAEARIRAILAGDLSVLAEGDAFLAGQEALSKASFRSCDGAVIVRASEAFVSHLYVCPDGQIAKAIVAFNPESEAVTVSLADPIPGVSCRAIVQGLWGPDAGGHDGIAGSPRGRKMTLADAEVAAKAVAALV